MFDLKKFRESKLKMTQAEFAELIGVRQDSVSRLEASSEQISLDILMKIAQITGTTLDELVNYKRPAIRALEVKDTWSNANFIKNHIVNYINEQSIKYKNHWGNKYDKYVCEIKEGVERVLAKPKIAIVGYSDVGKSRLINSIIGSEKMPTSWTPTTSITIYIKHISDRPSYIEEETWIFRASVDDVGGWNEKKLHDEDYCRKWKIASGSSDILKDYGTRQGEMFGKDEAGAAVIFVESDILKVCDVLDLPGFGTGDRIEDDTMPLKAKEIADILIYMSHSGQFLQGHEMEYLKESINSLNVIENKNKNDFKPLANLFIVASHAHTVEGGNLKALNNILDSGCRRLFKTMPQGYFMYKSLTSGYKYDFGSLRSRFFTYTTDIEQLRKPFEDELKVLVETLPIVIIKKAMDFISDFIKSIESKIDKEIEEYTDIINERNKYSILLKEIEKNEPFRNNENKNRKNALIEEIKKMERASILSFFDFYEHFMTETEIVRIIKEKELHKKKEDMKILASYINANLQGELQKILQSESEKLKVKIDTYVADFEGSIRMDNFNATFPGVNFTFNAKEAFASGLAGLATFGGLAIWASTLGNLGAYILVAKGVSILSAIGISVGGVATATAAVASIGGPIVIGIAIAIFSAISIFTFLSGGWEKRIAKKIVKEYESINCQAKFKSSIEQFWLDTERAFNSSADALDKEWESYVNELKEIVINHDVNKMQNIIKDAEKFKKFIVNIPLLDNDYKK